MMACPGNKRSAWSTGSVLMVSGRGEMGGATLGIVALDEKDREWIKESAEGIAATTAERFSDALGKAMGEEIGPLRTTLKETLHVQKQILDAQEKLRTEMPLALAKALQPFLDEHEKRI